MYEVYADHTRVLQLLQASAAKKKKKKIKTKKILFP